MKTYTFDDIAKLGPCYLRDGRESLLRQLIGTGLTREGIASAPASWSDRLWVLVRLMPTADVPRYAADIAESVLHLTRERDRAVCQEAIDAARSGDRQRAAAAYAAAYAAAPPYAAAAYAAARAAAAAYYAARAAAAADAAADAAAAAYAAADAAAAHAAKGEECVQIALRYVP